MVSDIKIALLVFIAVLSLAAQEIEATQIIYKNPRDLGRESTVVALGTVADVRCFWNADHTKIYTEVSIAVDQTYKGQPNSVVKLIQLGGVVGNVRVTVHGALQWTVGEEVLVFLEPFGNHALQVSGFSQGKFKITRDRGTGEPFVENPSGIGGGPALSSSHQSQPSHDSVRKTPLDAFVNDALGGR
jgi:hypothetical protein